MRVCQRTHQGRVRSSNQDCLLVDGCVYGVADGMGGHQGGETASRVAVQVLKNALRGKLPDRRALEVGMEAANRRVYDMARHDSSLSGMGTTLVGLILQEATLWVVNVGDSRAYRITKGGIRRITRDHSVVEDLVARGDLTPEQARSHPQKNLITRALGTSSRVKADLFQETVSPGDAILLCSDGLVNQVTDQEICQEIQAGGTAQEICQRLVTRTLDSGAPDNVTVVLFQL